MKRKIIFFLLSITSSFALLGMEKEKITEEIIDDRATVWPESDRIYVFGRKNVEDYRDWDGIFSEQDKQEFMLLVESSKKYKNSESIITIAEFLEAKAGEETTKEEPSHKAIGKAYTWANEWRELVLEYFELDRQLRSQQHSCMASNYENMYLAELQTSDPSIYDMQHAGEHYYLSGDKLNSLRCYQYFYSCKKN